MRDGWGAGAKKRESPGQGDNQVTPAYPSAATEGSSSGDGAVIHDWRELEGDLPERVLTQRRPDALVSAEV